MIVNGIEINEDNLSDKGLSTLRSAQATLAHYVGQKWGNVTEEKILMKLISVEIRQKYVAIRFDVDILKDKAKRKEP